MSAPYTGRGKGNKIITPGSGAKNPNLMQSDLSRNLPRQMSTGTTRGTQTVGYGNTKIDGSNNRITIGTPDGGTIGLGNIPGTDPAEYGFFSLDSDGSLVVKIVDGTFYVYDGDLDRMQAGILPDGSINVAISKEGESVSDAITP